MALRLADSVRFDSMPIFLRRSAIHPSKGPGQGLCIRLRHDPCPWPPILLIADCCWRCIVKEPFWKSGRFWVAVIGVVVVVAADTLKVSEETVWQVAGLIATYILGRSLRNTAAK